MISPMRSWTGATQANAGERFGSGGASGRFPLALRNVIQILDFEHWWNKGLRAVVSVRGRSRSVCKFVVYSITYPD